MKRLLLAVALVVPLTTGCQTGCVTKCGYGVWFYNPPSMTVETPVLLQAQIPNSGAHPMGSAAGPVPAGQFQQAPVIPVPTTPAHPPLNGKVQLGPVDAGCAPPVMSCDQWLKVYEACKNDRMKLP